MSAQHPGSMKPPRKLHIKSYGCQMNVYDAQRMADTLAPEGFIETASVDDADLSSSTPATSAKRPPRKSIRNWGGCAWSRTTPRAMAAACRSRWPAASRRRRPGDHPPRAGGRCRGRPQSYHHLPQLLARAVSHGRALETEFPVEDKFGLLAPPQPEAIRARGISSFVTVQEGCDKFCTFCVVPYTRGAEVSRPVSKIVDDVRRLADHGVREITLIGQNVNAYHGEGRTAAPGRSAACCIGSPSFPASCACVIRPAIPATSTTP